MVQFRVHAVNQDFASSENQGYKCCSRSVQLLNQYSLRMGKFKKAVKINDRKSVAMTTFRRMVWVHLKDEKKQKRVSFSKEDFVALLESLPKIRKYIKTGEKTLTQKEEDTDSMTDSDEHGED